MDAKAGKDTFWESHVDSQHMVGNDHHNTSTNCNPGSKESDTFNLEIEIPKGDSSKEIDSLSILGQHKCQLCPLSFSIRNDLDTHVMTEHTSDPKVINQTCETITMTSASNDKNIKSKTVAIDSFLKIIQTCSTGSSKAVDTSNFAAGQHKCQMCPLSFSLRDDLDEHVDSVHNQVSDEHKDFRTAQSEKKVKRKYQCLICKVSYCSRSSFKWHLFRSHSMDWRLSGIDWSVELNCNKCPFCSRFLFNFSGLKLHVKKKHPEEDINSLDEIRTKFGDYRNRLKTETVNDQQTGDFEKYTEEEVEIGIKYKCPACGLFISNFANLKRHMHRRHPNKRNLEKVTVESTRVAVPISDEQATKESKGIFKCPYCSLLMYSFFSVRRHVETRHPTETQDITLERTRASGQLDQLEKNSKSNKEPQITSSGRENKADQSSETEKVDYKSRIQHQCLFCSYVSSSFSNVKRHSLSWHGDKDLSTLKYRNTKIWPHGSTEKKANVAESESYSLNLEGKDVDFEKVHLQKNVGEGDGSDVVSDGFKCENISKTDKVKQALKKTECVNVSEENTKSNIKAKLSIVKTRNNLQSNSEDRKTRSSLRRSCKGSSCGKCGEIFKNKFSKFEHECTSVSKQEFVCTECDKYFVHLKSLNHHFKSKHKGRALSKPSADEPKDRTSVADKLTHSQKGASQKKRDCLSPRHTKMSSMTDDEEKNKETEDIELHLEVFPDMDSVEELGNGQEGDKFADVKTEDIKRQEAALHFRSIGSDSFFLCPVLDQDFIYSSTADITQETSWGSNVLFRCELCKKSFCQRRNVEMHLFWTHARVPLYICKCSKFQSNMYSEIMKHICQEHKYMDTRRVLIDNVTIILEKSSGKRSLETATKCFESKDLSKDGKDPVSKETIDEEFINCNAQSIFRKTIEVPVCEKLQLLSGLLLKGPLEDIANIECGACRRTFKWRKSLRRHLQSYHKMTLMYSCPFCPKTYFNIRDTLYHLHSLHMEESQPSYACVLFIAVNNTSLGYQTHDPVISNDKQPHSVETLNEVQILAYSKGTEYKEKSAVSKLSKLQGSENASKMEEKESEPKKLTDKDIQSLKETTVPVIAETCKKDEPKVASIEKASQVKDSAKNSSNRKEVLKRKREDLGYSALKRVKTEKRNDEFGTKQIGLPSQGEKVAPQKLRCSGGNQIAVTMDTKDKDEDYVCPKCSQRFKRMTALKFHMNMKHGDKSLGLSDLSSLSKNEARRAEVKPQKNKSTVEKRAKDLNKNSQEVKEKFKIQKRQFSDKMVKLESKDSGEKQSEMSLASGNFNRKNDIYETDSEKGKPQIHENTTAEQSSDEIHDQSIKSNKSSIDDKSHEISFKRTDGEGIASGEVSQASRKMVKVYKCPFCCAVFMKFAALNHHCKRCHLDEDLSNVNSVSTRHFKFIEELEAEGIKTDQMMSFYKCPFCPLVCDQFPNLSRHAQRRHADQDLAKVTNASTRIMKSLKDVAETKVGVQFGLPYVFKCPECPSTTNQFIELQSHLAKDHPSREFSSLTAENTKIYKVLQDGIFFPGSTTGQISIYKCPFCSQVCRHYPNLLRHGQRRHKDRDLNLIDRDKTKTKAEAVFTPKEYRPKKKNSGMDDEAELADSVSAPDIEASQDIDDDGEEISSSSNMIIRDNKAQKSTKGDTRKTVKCDLCGHIVHRQKLEKHLTLYCWNNPKTCNQCGLVFKRGIRLQQHMFVHTGDTPYPCNECGKSYIRSHSLNMHYKKVHANLPKNHKCPNCSKAFLFKSQLTEHERIHDSTDRPICDVCGKSLAGRNSLKRHQMHKHPELFDAQAVQKYSKTLVCHICGLVLKSRGGLKKHLSRTHQDGKELKCHHCSQTFQSAKVYHKHLLHVKHEELRIQSVADKDDESSKQNSVLDKDNEDENKRFIPLTSTDRGISQLRDICRRYRIEEKSCSDLPHKCILCGKRFRKVKYCNLHIRRYHIRDEHKPLRCKVCGAGFVLMNEFKNHARVHTDIRPYQCKICSKRFKQSNHLQDHFKSHKKERCEKCQICGMQFKVRGALSAHVQRHSKIKPYECPHCHQKFVDRGSLTRHLSNYFKDGAVACHICFQKFNFNSGLAKHLDTHILQRPFPCKLCDQNFTCFTSLYYHKVRCNHFLEEDYDDVYKKETKQANSEKSETMALENIGEILEATPGTKDGNPDVDAETPETLVREESYELNKENSNKETVNADSQQGSNVITDRLQEEVVPSLTGSFLELSTAGVLEEEIGFRYIREEGDEHLLILDADEEYLTEILKKKAAYTLIHGTNENSPGIDVPADCENYVSKNIATMEVDESSTSQMAVVNSVSAGEEGEKFVRTSCLSQDKGIDTGSENAVPGVYLEDMVVEVDVHTQTEILDPHTLGSRETDVHTQTEILDPHSLGSRETAQTQTDHVMEQAPLDFGTRKENVQLVQEEGSVKCLPEDQSRIKTQDLSIIYSDADANTACSVPSEDTLSLSLTDQGYTKNVLTSSYSYIDEEGNTVYVCITETPSNTTGSLDQEVINAAMMVDGECVISSSNQISTIGEIFLSGIEHSYTLTTEAEKKHTQKDTYLQSTKLQNQAKEKHMQDVSCFLDMVDKLEKQETSGGVVPLIVGSNFLDNLAEGDEEGPSKPTIVKKSASSSKSQIGTKSFQCSVCEKSFAKVKYLNLHKKRHIPDDDRAFKCPKCSKGFSRSSELERHINIHSNNRQFVCDICQQSFIQKGHLMTHKLTHTGEKPYQCKYCNQGFTTGSNRKIHELKHSGATSYECTICKKNFHHRAAWMTHRVSHTKLLQVSKIEEANEVMKDDVQSKFICDICGKVYQSNSGLKLHMDRHQEDKPFSCNICSRDYQSKNLLQEHLKIHQKKKSEESIACEFCGKVFQKRASLYSHIKTHKKKVQYRCINCGKEYASTSSYTYHVAKCCMENEDTAS
ncbi:hypothetical protein ACJMK2_004963 [Sinanodonta woodiana]|uniref:C2H2-type domain-containing protein n=1 Tax=Sinanodonta woodiana TaxID=1069815 RepID=A0ABD3VRP4_SINWO